MPNEITHPKITDWGADASEALQAHDSELAALRTRRPPPAFVEQFAASVRDSPCSTEGTSDYADARYYLDRCVATSGATTELAVRPDALPGLRQCLTATNLCELAAGTHLLPPGTVVQVFALYTRPGVKVYVFNQPPPEAAVVMISGPAGGGGKYTGRVLTGSSTAVDSGDLNMPEGLADPGADDALICNEEETGQTGHRLAAPGYAVGTIAGTRDGKTIVMIRGAAGATDGPTTLGDGTGGGVDADGASWSKSADATPLDAWVQTRTVWDSASGTLYAYVRKFSFDARGLLYQVSAETQVTVDVAQPCA